MSKTKYIIFKNGEEIACKRVTPDGVEKYILAQSRFDRIVENFYNEGYRVKLGSYSLFLSGRKTEMKILDFKNIMSHPSLDELKRDIDVIVAEQGYYDLVAGKKVTRKPNREKSNSNANKYIKICSCYSFAAILFLANLINHFSENPITPNPPIDDSPIKPYELVIDNTPLPEEEYERALAHIIGETNYQGENPIIFNTPGLEESEEELSTEFATLGITPEEEIVNEKDIEEATPSQETIEGREEHTPTVDEILAEIHTGYLDYDDLSQTEKAESTKENYYDKMCTNAKRFGLDENLLLAVATQERGVHSSEIDAGGGIGLMQIQYSVCINQTLEYYELNPETGGYDKKTITVTDELLRNEDSNIMLGAIILQQSLRWSNYNIPVAIQMYNQGYGSIMNILDHYAKETGKSVEDILKNPEDLGWLKYRNLYNGDSEYLENINKWVSDNSFEVVKFDDLTTTEFEFVNGEETQNSQTTI